MSEIGNMNAAKHILEMVKSQKWSVNLNVIDCNQLIKCFKNGTQQDILSIIEYMDQHSISFSEITYICLFKVIFFFENF
jgi:hypothetical protein